MINYINKEYSLAKTPTTSNEWKNKSDIDRIKLIEGFLRNKRAEIECEVIKADEDGQIILKIEKNIPANSRGVLLLKLEEDLKKFFDEGITLWLEPVGDKSKLRNLRGITIKGN